MKLARALWQWADDRFGISKVVGPIMRHPVPPTGWKYVLGSATLTAFIIQIVTGIALATIYNSSPNGAYQSLQFITDGAAMGRFLRGLHYFGASAMFLLLAAHWTRVYLTGSYKFPREGSWLSGILLVGCVTGMGFTGQLLRWDQTGVWSVVIAAEQAGRVPFVGHWLAQFVFGGNTPNAVTLSRFFAIHIFFIPATMFALLGVHLYLVLHNGISEPPKAGHPVDPATYRAWYHDLLKRAGVPFWPDAIWRDAVASAVLVILVAMFAWTWGPPALGKPPDPSIIQAEPRPDWYLLWYFAVMALMPRKIENVMIVVLPLLAFLILFFMPILWNKGERSIRRRPWAVFVIICIYFMVGYFWYLGRISPWSPHFDPAAIPVSLVEGKSADAGAGAKLFQSKACEECHKFHGLGGDRGPDLTRIANRYTHTEIVTHILNGGENMPAFGGLLTAQELDQITAFLESDKTAQFATPQ